MIDNLELTAAILLIIAILYLSKAVKNKLTYKKVSLFSPAEKNFLYALDRALGRRYRIFAKVRIADVIMPGKNMSKKNWNKHFWKISSKHIDYVLCEKSTLKVVCLIELNDKSHNKRDRKSRDILVSEICLSANMPLVWINARRSYDDAHIVRRVKEEIEKSYHKEGEVPSSGTFS